MDAHVVETLNTWFTANTFRADLCRALAIAPLAVIGVLMVLAWSTPDSNAPEGRAELLLGVLAALGALLLNLALGHLYYRARPFLVLDVRPLLPEAVDSSLFSDHLAVAGAAAAALSVARRVFGWAALGFGALLAIGRVRGGRVLRRLASAARPGLESARSGLSGGGRTGTEDRARIRSSASPRDRDRPGAPAVRHRVRDPRDPGSRLEGGGAPGRRDAAGELGACATR